MKSEITFKGNGDVVVTFTAESEAEKLLLGSMANRPAAVVYVDFEGHHTNARAKDVTIAWE